MVWPVERVGMKFKAQNNVALSSRFWSVYMATKLYRISSGENPPFNILEFNRHSAIASDAWGSFAVAQHFVV